MDQTNEDADHVDKRLPTRRGNKTRVGGKTTEAESGGRGAEEHLPQHKKPKEKDAAESGGRGAEEHLPQHKKPKEKDAATRKLIQDAMKQDRICGSLGDAELGGILEAMEFYEFQGSSMVVEQGKTGSTFFVIESGTLEVSLNGTPCNTLAKGTAFGAISLLYNCPRTASVKAVSDCGVWGTSGPTFHTVMKENSQKNFSANRKILDSIPLFDALTPKQKDSVCEACFTETYEAGSRVVTQGESAPVIYFVKKGDLAAYTGGNVQPNGEFDGGTQLSSIGAGDCFGERAVLEHQPRTSTVVTKGKSELLCVSASAIIEVLGTDLGACLERNYVLTGFRQSPKMNEFVAAHHLAFAKAMVVTTLKAGEKIGGALWFLAILDGQLVQRAGTKLERGQWCDECEAAGTLAAGEKGARVTVLSSAKFSKICQDLGLSSGGNAEEASDKARKAHLVKKVPIFRHLSQEQTLRLVDDFTLSKYKKDDAVFNQGDSGTTFYVIANGEVTIKIDGVVKRTLGRNAYFGERALLFDEPRSAHVQASSAEVELWSVSKESFEAIMNKNMQEELMLRIRLQNTNVTLKDIKQVKVIGTGATGVVRLVEHKESKTRYALKRVQKSNGKVPEEVKRECDLLAENDHPFIMKLVKTYETTKSIYMLTELITGGELHGAIRVIPTVLARAQAQFYTGSLVIVLEELAGRNIVYRDLKPENVMLDHQGYLKLIDFGIAKKLDDGKNRTFTMVGTPHYMAPEVMRGQGYSTPVDLWSLGVIHFEFVCGFLPFADEMDDPTEVCAAVLKAALTFPPRYRDQAGRTLMQGLLCRQPKKRLGAGANGYDDVRSADFFKEARDGAGETKLFDRIMGRELSPPLVPKGETYCDPEDADQVKLSDQDELG